MKRVYILLALISAALLVVSCGGGGGGSSGSPDEPEGQSPGVPSSMQLLPAEFVSQTNGGVIVLNAKVLDGNGNPVGNVPVTFVKQTTLGDLSTTGATTNTSGIATASLSSTTSGFVTAEASITVGGSRVRDRKTVFFTDGNPAALRPTLSLSVQGNGDPFVLFETLNDTDVNVTARVLDIAGVVVFGSEVTFDSNSSEVEFPLGNTAATNQFGEASVLVRVTPAVLRDIGTTLNITASADVGAFNVVTLFTQPVFVNSVQLFANPSSVESGGSGDVVALALTTAGTPVPDGTTINFTVNGGAGIDPFAQTPDGDVAGAASAAFTAPTLDEGAANRTLTVTASVGGKSGTATITVIAPPAPPVEPQPLAINPPTAAAIGTSGATITFNITGGTAPYTTSSSNLFRAFNDANSNGVLDAGEGGIWTGTPVRVTVPVGAPVGTVDLNVSDSVGGTSKATITVQ